MQKAKVNSNNDFFTAFSATISSRKKIRPEAKFQKVVTSKILSQMRKDSRIISKDPQSFLERMVQEQSRPEQVNTDLFTSLLTSLSKDSATDHYQTAVKNLERKSKQAKNRTLLLNLGSNSAIQGPDWEIESTNSNESEDQVDKTLQYFLDEIRMANVESIVEWLERETGVKDSDLPFGLLENGLKMPTKDFSNISSSTLIEFIKSATDQFFLLDAEYHAKLEELMKKSKENLSELQRTEWSANDSAILFHLMCMLQSQSDSHKAGFRLSSEKLCTDVALRIFPSYSREQVITQKFRLKVKRVLEEKQESIIKDWKRDKEKLVKKINGAWDDIRRKEMKVNELESEKRLQKEKCIFWMTKLEQMQQSNQKKIRTIETLIKPMEEQIKQNTVSKEKEENRRRCEEKHHLLKFRQMKMKCLETIQQRKEEEEAAKEKERRLRSAQNQVRVDIRKKAFEMKRVVAQELERKQAREKEERMAKLEKIKEKVEIDYHPANILNDTHASLLRGHEIQNLLRSREENETVNFFRERYSFSAETLWKDARVRLETKLREAGLIDKSYARHVLLAMQPQPKPHLKSNIKFEPTD